jgi:acyl dehydratase
MKEGIKSACQLPNNEGISLYIRALLTLARSGQGEIPTGTRRFFVPPISRQHLSEYISDLKFLENQKIPITYLYLFAQRAQLALMLDDRFPFPVMGMIHVSNELTWFAEPDLMTPWWLEIRINKEPITDSGAHYISFDVNFIQNEKAIALCRSRYLAKRGKKVHSTKESLVMTASSGELVGKYRLAEEAGRIYAKLSGDSNPIHLWKWTARLFGFKKPLIQGMHTLARVTALIEHSRHQKILAIQANFLKPIMLPSEVEVRFLNGQFEVWSGSMRSLSGVVTFE